MTIKILSYADISQPVPQATGIEAMNPTTSEEFKALEDALAKKLSTLEASFCVGGDLY